MELSDHVRGTFEKDCLFPKGSLRSQRNYMFDKPRSVFEKMKGFKERN